MKVFVTLAHCKVCGNRMMTWSSNRHEQPTILCPEEPDESKMRIEEQGKVELSKIKEHEGKVNSLEHLRS